MGSVDGVDALGVRLMLALFTYCIFFLLPAPKEGSTAENGVRVLTEIG